MNTEFIKLTRKNGSSIHIYSYMITVMEESSDAEGTLVHCIDGKSWHVTETVSEIRAKIKDSQTFKMTYYDPIGPGNKNYK